MSNLILLLNLLTTLFMTGVIWFIQVVHYPLFAKVGKIGYAEYQRIHSSLTTYVVFPPMVIELATAIILVFARPPELGAVSVWAGLLLVGVIWLTTAFASVPQHNILAGGFDVQAHAKLVATNWIRTIAWTLRSALVIWWVWPG